MNRASRVYEEISLGSTTAQSSYAHGSVRVPLSDYSTENINSKLIQETFFEFTFSFHYIQVKSMFDICASLFLTMEYWNIPEMFKNISEFIMNTEIFHRC